MGSTRSLQSGTSTCCALTDTPPPARFVASGVSFQSSLARLVQWQELASRAETGLLRHAEHHTGGIIPCDGGVAPIYCEAYVLPSLRFGQVVMEDGLSDHATQLVVVPGADEELLDRAFVDCIGDGLQVRVAGEHDADGVEGEVLDPVEALAAVHSGRRRSERMAWMSCLASSGE